MQSWSAGEDQRKPLSSYAQALLEQESLRPLGEAILAQDMAAVERALEQMGESLTALEGNQRVNALMGVVYDISATLQRGVQDEGQAKLTHAMAVLSGTWEGAAAMKYGRQDSASAIWAALDKARDSIASFLAGDQAYQDSGEAESALPRAPPSSPRVRRKRGPRCPPKPNTCMIRPRRRWRAMCPARRTKTATLSAYWRPRTNPWTERCLTARCSPGTTPSIWTSRRPFPRTCWRKSRLISTACDLSPGLGRQAPFPGASRPCALSPELGGRTAFFPWLDNDRRRRNDRDQRRGRAAVQPQM